MRSLVIRFLKYDSGATAIQYGLIAAVNTLGGTLNGTFANVNGSIKNP
jgi:pilus assembly protein Flp/PilA